MFEDPYFWSCRLVRVPFLIDNNTMEYAFDNYWDTYFGQTLFETINLPRYAQVGALPSYNGSDIEAISIEVPNKSEQEHIGSFSNNLITLSPFISVSQNVRLNCPI